MAQTDQKISHEIDHLFRHEYGKLVSVLTRSFGTSNIELAEDVVQEAMLEALNKWTYNGVPDNPVGWIYKVAKFKAINILNRDKYSQEFTSETVHQLQSIRTSESTLEHIFTDQEIADDQLRMIFTCCHPAVSSDSQVSLTLKTLCGFSISEIAQAFLTSEENINKRLVRARKTIKNAAIPFEVPTGKVLKGRLSSVLETLYLLFNEGYNSTSGNDLVRFELCEEAIRLMEIIASNPLMKSSNVHGLLALMMLNASRFNSRVDESDNLMELAHQDRSKWDPELIKKGLSYLQMATQQNEVSIYHILATISAHHCTAPTYELTDWKGILSLYDMLLEIDKSPLILLNRAVVLSKTDSPEKALRQLEPIKDNPAFHFYLPYYLTLAELHFQNKEHSMALKFLAEASKLSLEPNRKKLITKKIEAYSKIS